MIGHGQDGDGGYVSKGDLIAYLDDYLESAAFQDYGPNGLQVDGREEIRHLITGVSACRTLLREAVERGADSVLVHHGLLWNNLPRSLTGIQYQRVAELIRSDTSLIAYHLPLDAHGEIGNNVLIARQLELKELAPFGDSKGRTIGFRGAYDAPISAGELALRCRKIFDQEPLLLGNTESAAVRTVAVISGGAQDFLYQAITEGLDAFITGEASEWVTNLAREAGICYIAAGHYATERQGVRALGEHLAARFGIRAEFIDVPNPV